MKPECYSCHGFHSECVGKSYTPYADSDTCILSVLAKKDKERREKGNFQAITSRQNLAEYLFDNGEKQKALEVLI